MKRGEMSGIWPEKGGIAQNCAKIGQKFAGMLGGVGKSAYLCTRLSEEGRASRARRAGKVKNR